MKRGGGGKNAVAVFLDRDGTINEDVGYLSDPADLILIDGAARAIKRLNDCGVKAIVITNQSGVARGYFSEKELGEINRKLADMLSEGGARLDGIYYCPHHPDDGCPCRKPDTGLAARAAGEHGVATARSYVVGDKPSDMELARNFGGKAVLVLTGEGKETLGKLDSPPDYVAPDISGAVDWILDDMGTEKPYSRLRCRY